MTDFEPIDDGTRPSCETGSEALQRFFDGEAAWDSSAAIAHRLTCIECREELALARPSRIGRHPGGKEFNRGTR